MIEGINPDALAGFIRQADAIGKDIDAEKTASFVSETAAAGSFRARPVEAALAVELLGVRDVIPMHYGTFPILSGTPDALREAIAARGLSGVTVHAPAVGGTIGG